jgi:hypothetical protein
MLKSGIEAPKAPIGFLASLWKGVGAVNSHPVLLLIPVLLDALLWFGPHLSILNIITPALRAMGSAVTSVQADPAILEFLRDYFTGFNLFTFLSFLPLFPPSIMAARMPSATPLGPPINVQISDPAVCIVTAASLVVFSICLGSIYWVAAGSATVEQRWTVREITSRWARTTGNMLVLVISFAIALLVALFVIFTFNQLISLFWPAGAALLIQLFLFAVGGIFFWLVLFMVFTPHGTVLFQDGLLRAIWNSIETARWIYPLSMWIPILMLVLNVIATSIWSLPDEKDWISVLSVLGNAYTSSVLVTASFVYYRDKRRWIGEVRALMQSQRATDTPPNSTL